MIIKTLPFFVCLLFPAFLSAQCGLTETSSPQTFGNNTNSGVTSWQNTSNIDASDNSFASVSALILGSNSHYLTASNFNFNLPVTSLICGIEIRMEKSAFGLFHSVQDESVRLIVGGALSGTDKAGAGVWPGGDTYFTHGNSTDTWGNALTVADVNAADFGVGIQVNLSGLAVLPTAFIDHVEITIHYASTLPVELTDLSASVQEPNSAIIEWTTHSETNNDYFIIESSDKGEVWTEKGRIKGAGNSSENRIYDFIDKSVNSTSYYRVLQIDFDKTISIAGTAALDKGLVECEYIYPNPCSHQLNLKLREDACEIKLFNAQGRLVFTTEACEQNVIQVENYKKGLYLIQVSKRNGESETFKFQKL